jgi:iron complex outermembrane receptor protein
LHRPDKYELYTDFFLGLGQAGNVKGGSIVLNLVSKKTFKSALLAGTAATAALAVTAVPAIAQDTSSSVEKVTVTGTRLKKRDYSTTSPVTTVGSQTFELTQTTSVEGLLNDLPQLVPGNTFTSNNSGGEDFATIDLRGLGPNRTLILVNGNRMPASSTTGTTDISAIPAGLIDRVEVVTGGASAVYGSDAMAGVVNFILKKDYEGLEITASAGQAERGLAETRNIQALVGGNFAGGNGNITMFAEYFSREGVYQSEFDFARTSGSYCYSFATGQYSVVDTRAEAQACRNQVGGGIVSPGGSGTPSWGWITNNGANPFTNLSVSLPGQFTNVDTDCNPSTAPVAAVNTGNLSFNNLGQLTPRFTSGACGTPDRGNGLAGNSSRYNFAPDNYIILPAERYNVSAFGHYDIEKDLTLNFGAIYSDSYTQVSLAPTPATGLSITLTPAMTALIGANAPDLLTALNSRANPTANFTMDRRMNEVGRRVGHNENSSLNLFASLEGQISDSWSYEIAASFADIDFVTRAENSVNKTALAQGLAGCQTPLGAPLGAAALPGCVPLDIFGPNTLTQPMVDFLRVTTWQRTQVEEAMLSGFVSGEAWDLFGAGPMSMVAGGEYRYSKASFQVDNEQRTGNIFGFNATQDQAGALDVFEGYTEVSLPIVKDQPFMYYLGVEGGYRLSDYSTAGVVHTYKYGGEYSPFEWLKFRGVYNKATRVASVFESFQDGDQGFPGYTDPCRDANSNGAPDVAGVTLTDCTTQGVPLVAYPGFVANNSQVEAFAFGNANLSPETAETTTYGIVLQTGDDWFGIGNLRGSVDKYEIEISDVIAAFGAQFFINDCYVNGNLASCGNVVRDPVTGQIDFVNTSRGNQGTLATNGMDIQVDYRLDLAEIGLGGILSINELYSIIDSYTINGAEFAGSTSAGIGGGIFDWKSVTQATYVLDEWTLYARWSYVPALVERGWNGQKAPAASYVDMAVRYAPVDWLSVTLTVNNVADDEAPQTLNGLFDQANTDPQIYDVTGRSWSLAVKTKM